MASLTPPQMYRSVLKQFVQNSIHPRLQRSKTISLSLRSLFESGKSFKPNSKELIQLGKEAENMVVYLKSHRLHKELVERYNPTNTLSGQERARMSAGMVGLNMPKAFDPNEVPTMEGDRSKEKRRQLAEEGKGSLQTMFNA